MTTKTIEMGTYKISLYLNPVTIYFPGGFSASNCYGSIMLTPKNNDDDRFYLAIIDKSISPSPVATTLVNPTSWTSLVTILRKQYHDVIDLLRNESPIYAHLSDTSPTTGNYLSTDPEPIGEGIDIS